jgi:thymidylate synthase
MKFEPLECSEQLDIINPEGSAGIVTLWDDPVDQKEKLREKYPRLLGKDSPIVTVASLYGNGLPEMLANLAYNPQINKIAIFGEESQSMVSSRPFLNFLERGVTYEDIGGTEFAKVKGTEFYLDPALKPEMYSGLKVERFRSDDLDGLVSFLSQGNSRECSDSDRVAIELMKPSFTDFPSDIVNHNIVAGTPTEAWAEVLWSLDKYGVNMSVPKGDIMESRRGLFNLDVNVSDPGFESEERLKRFGLSPENLREYQKEILEKELPKGRKYTYGNRLGLHFGGDALGKMSELLRGKSTHRHCYVSLWDTGRDLLERESEPCFTDAYCIQDPRDDSLMMTAGFRTHNAGSAWIKNFYGLRAIQEKVAKDAGLRPGQLNVRSRAIGINPDHAGAIIALAKKNRRVKFDFNPSIGYFVFGADHSAGDIVASHFNPNGVPLKEYSAKHPLAMKGQIARDCRNMDPDHAMWLGMQMQKVYMELGRGGDE